MKCGTSGILPVIRREQNEVDDFSKSTSQLKSTNRDSSICSLILSNDLFALFRHYFILFDFLRQ